MMAWWTKEVLRLTLMHISAWLSEVLHFLVMEFSQLSRQEAENQQRKIWRLSQKSNKKLPKIIQCGVVTSDILTSRFLGVEIKSFNSVATVFSGLVRISE